MKLKQIIKNELPNFDVEKFKEKYHDIFWSCIWFFEVYKIRTTAINLILNLVIL